MAKLSESDQARFVNLAGTLGVIAETEVAAGRLRQEFADTVCVCLLIMTEIVGIPDKELHEASAAFIRSKDPQKWIENMIGTS